MVVLVFALVFVSVTAVIVVMTAVPVDLFGEEATSLLARVVETAWAESCAIVDVVANGEA